MTADIRQLLGRIHALNGVSLAAVVASDGLLIEGVADAGVEVDPICAVASNGLVMAEAVGREINKGGAIQAILEFDNGVVVLEPLGDDAMVLVVSDRRENLGRIRFLLRQLHEPLSQAVRAI
jgi:predicted regulator of Ras-like GTPase activity (Roadblock/LC7/MglB family)